MVSVERYLRAFVKVMPQRAKILRFSMRKKRSLDSKLRSALKRGKSDKVQLFALEIISILGKDILFKSAERRNKQTLRHYLWKISKSFRFFIENRNYIGKNLQKEPKYATQFLTILKESIEDSQNLFKSTKYLDGVYAQEVESLENKNFDLYYELAQKEQKFIESIVRYGASVKQRQGGALRFIQSYLKQTGKTENDREGRMIWIFVIISSALFSLTVYVFSPSMEAENVEVLKWLSLIGTFVALYSYRVFIGENNPMQKIIREYVMNTI